MSLFRTVDNCNPLPFLIYLERFFQEYSNYFINEKERIDKLQFTSSLDKSLQEISINYVENVLNKIQFIKYDSEIIQECVKLLRIIDSEMSIMKLEIQKISNEDTNNENEVQLLEKERKKIIKEINKMELEKEYWNVFFRMRNINLISEQGIQEMKLYIGEDEELMENPSDKVKPLQIICTEFLKDNRFELAAGLVGDKLNALKVTTKNKPNLDIASMYALMGSICGKNNDYLMASQNFKACLEIREKLLTKHHPDIGTIKYNYSLVLIKNKDYVEAENLLRSALEIKIKELGEEHTTIAMIYNFLGKISDLTKKPLNAVNYYKLALNILKKIPESFELAYLYISIAISRNYMELQQTKNAEIHFEKIFLLIQTSIGIDNNKIDSCFTYFKKNLNDAKGENLYILYGSFTEYDIIDLFEILMKYFKNHAIILEAIDVWKSLSLKSS